MNWFYFFYRLYFYQNFSFLLSDRPWSPAPGFRVWIVSLGLSLLFHSFLFLILRLVHFGPGPVPVNNGLTSGIVVHSFRKSQGAVPLRRPAPLRIARTRRDARVAMRSCCICQQAVHNASAAGSGRCCPPPPPLPAPTPACLPANLSLCRWDRSVCGRNSQHWVGERFQITFRFHRNCATVMRCKWI